MLVQMATRFLPLRICRGAPRRFLRRTPAQQIQRNAYATALRSVGLIRQAGTVPAWRAYADRHQMQTKNNPPQFVSWHLWAMKFNIIRARNNLPPLLLPPTD
jgi:hypothetical protein